MATPDDAYPPAARTPLHAMLAAFPAVCFTLALFTDIAFWRSANLMWQNFSAWLLFAGLVFGGLAIVIGLLSLVFRRSRTRERRPMWLRAVGGFLVLALATLNSFVHGGDGWTAVVPYGLILSAVTVLLIVIIAFLGSTDTFAHRTTVAGARHA